MLTPYCLRSLVGENLLAQSRMNTACFIIVCTSFIGESQTIKPKRAQIETCVEISQVALANGLDQSLAMAVGWEESRYTKKATSNKGAVGPMQILPKYWCPNGLSENCDLLLSGIIALKKLVGRYGLNGGLCRYSSGRTCKAVSRSRWYKNRVLNYKASLERLILKSCDGC